LKGLQYGGMMAIFMGFFTDIFAFYHLPPVITGRLFDIIDMTDSHAFKK
jgi:hypothetical protein